MLKNIVWALVYLAIAATILMCISLMGCASTHVEEDQTALTDPPPTWGQVFNAGQNYCLDLWGYHCASTDRWSWYYECLDDYAYGLADEAEATGCTAQAVGWMECEQTQFFTCENGWPYQWTDYCHAAADAYGACREDA